MAAEKNIPQSVQSGAPQSEAQGANDAQGQKVLGTSLEAQGSLGATALKIGQPGDNIAEVIGVESGKTYVMDFAKGSVIAATVKGGDLVVEFQNGASVVLKGYQSSSDVTLQLADGQSVSPQELLAIYSAQNEPSQEQLQEPANENIVQDIQQGENLLEQQLDSTQTPVMNGVEQLTEMDNPLEVIQEQIAENQAELMAEQLAQVEPAAGDGPAAAGGSQNNGFGFGSSFQSQGVIGLADVGPIDPTLLQYGLTERADDVRPNFRGSPITPDIIPKDPETEQNLEGAYKVYEDGSIQLLVEAIADLPGSILTVTIKGIPSTWTVTGEGTYNPATKTWTIKVPQGENYFGGPIVKPPADSDIDLNNLVFKVVEYNPETRQTGTATKIVDVIVDAVADEPDVDAPDQSGPEGTALDVVITGQAGDTDGSETVVKYQITGVPEGFTFNKGTQVSPGVWEFKPDEINGLKALPPNDDYHGSINLSVTVFTSETPITDRDFDNTNDDATASDPFKLTWTPAVDPPEVCVDLPKDPDSGVKNAQVYEDNTVSVRVTANLAPNADTDEILTVKVTGIDLTKLDNLNLAGEDGAVWVRVPGSPDNNASFTITLPAGSDYDGRFTFTPKAQSDLDLTNIKVTATAFDPSENKTADSNEDGFNVIVDAVADKPAITAGDVTGDEGKAIALNIAGQLGVDTDGSESITGYQIKGALTGFTFVDGAGNAVGTKVSDALWTFTPAQIAGLKIVPPAGDYHGTLNLTAVVLTKDGPTDIDFDNTNNTNFAEDPFKITWDQDDQPIVTNATETVDESVLDISETGNVLVNYGVDVAGKVTTNGEFNASGSMLNNTLSSGGTVVNITQAAVPGYRLYEGFAGDKKVFSIKIFENGNYEYQQFEPLDHGDPDDDNDIITLTFGVTATDGDGDATDGTITINVKDDAPIARDDKFCVEPSNDLVDAVNDDGGTITVINTTKTGNVLTNDDKGNDLPTIVTHVNGQAVGVNGLEITGSYGTLTIYQNGNYSYTSNKHGMGDENFTYTISDNNGDTDSAVLSFDLNCPQPLNNPPVAVDNKYTVYEVGGAAYNTDASGTKLTYGKTTFTLTGGVTVLKDTGTNAGGFWYKLPILGNDSDPDGDHIVITKIYNIQGLSKNYSLEVDPTGQFVIAKIGQDGNTKASTFTFEYQITDGKGGYDTACVTICVADHNSPLVLDLDGDGIELSGSIPGTQFDIDNDGQTEQVGWVGEDDGLLAIDLNNDGKINDQSELFGNNANFANGFANLASQDSNNDGKIDSSDAVFSKLRIWQDKDSDGITDAGELITLDALNIKSISLTAQEVDQDVAGNKITHVGTFTYDDGSTGQIADAWFETLENAPQTPVITPVVQDPAKALSERQISGNILANDTAGNDNGASVTAIKFGNTTYQIPPGGQISINGAHGYLTISSTGAFVFTAFVGENVQAEDIFTYTMRDFDGDTSTANVTLCVKPDNPPADDQPDARNDDGGTITTVNVARTGNVLTNDDKGDDLPTIVTHVNGQVVGPNGLTIDGTYGTLTIQQNGTYSYTNDQRVVGNESFTYTITDVDGDSDSAVLTFTLNCSQPVDDHPDARDDDGGTITTVNVARTGDVLTNDDKGDDLPTIVTHVNGQVVGPNGLTINGTYGTLTIQQNGTYSYTNNQRVVGNENFTYTITDVDGDSDSAVLTFTLNCSQPVDDRPDARNDNEGIVAKVNDFKTGNVMNNDDRGDDLPTLVTKIGTTNVGPNGLTINGQFGTLIIQQDGSYKYTRTSSNSGTENFTYTITDVDGDSDSAVLCFTIPVCPPPQDDKPIVAGGASTVDETGGFDTVSGKVTVTYGQDGPGTVSGTNSFNASYALTSAGQPISVSFAGTTYTGKDALNRIVFTLKVNTDGTYNFQQFLQIDHQDAFNPDDAVTLNFGIKATDNDGDATNGLIVITVKDDGPTAVNDGTYVLNAGSSLSGNVTTNDILSKDVPNTVTSVFEGDAGYPMGQNGFVTIQGLYGTLVMYANGMYTYTAKTGNIDGFDTFTYSLTDRDGDTSHATLKFDINPKEDCGCHGPDDKPIVANAVETVDETNLLITETGTVTVQYGQDGPGTIAGTNTFTSSYALKSNGTAVGVTFANGLYTGKAGNVTVFTLKVNANGTYEYKQFEQLDHANAADPNDIVTLNFGIKATDKDGDIGNGLIVINVKDDAPIAKDDQGGSLTTINQTRDGNVLPNDDKGEDTPGKVIKIGTTTVGAGGLVINGQYGTLTIQQDGSYVYKLTKHGMGSEVFTYTMQDYDGDTSSAKLTFTLDCAPETDDNPVIVDGYNKVDETGGLDSVSGTVNVNYGGDGPGTVAGSNTFTSSHALKSGGAAVSVTYANGVYTGTAGGATVFKLTLATDGAYTFQQFKTLDHPNAADPNDIVSLFFGVKATDKDGDVGNGKVKIDVYDDGPNAVDDTIQHETVRDQKRNYSGNILDNDTWGEDGGAKLIKTISFDGRTVDMGSKDQITVMIREANFMNLYQGMERTYGFALLTINKYGTYTLETGWTYDNDGKINAGRGGMREHPLKYRASADYIIDYQSAGQDFTYTIKDFDLDTDSAVFKVILKPTPLVFDLDGDGIELLDVTAGVRFDLGADGTLDNTAWVDSDDGLLAIDLNGDGRINDQNELFGRVAEDGFSVLSEYDSNGDGVIDLYDEAFDDLLIWKDLNADGISQDGELLSLKDLSIKSISLDAAETDKDIGGSKVGLEAEFTYEDGTTGTVADVWFETGDGSLYGTSGQADTFVLQAANDPQSIYGFNAGEGDKVDLSALLTDFDPLQDSIDDFVFATQSGADTILSFDAQGRGDASLAASFAVLEDRTLTLDELKTQQAIAA